MKGEGDSKSDFMDANFFGANKGYKKKMKGCENFHGKFKGCENFRRKFKGYDFFTIFSNRISKLKK